MSPSPIDAGDNAGSPSIDQRGFPRFFPGDSIIDIGSYEYSNSPPTISCAVPLTIKCGQASGALGTLSVNVADVDGDALVVVWTVGTTRVQTNLVPAGLSVTNTRVDLIATFPSGTNQVTVTVSDMLPGCIVMSRRTSFATSSRMLLRSTFLNPVASTTNL